MSVGTCDFCDRDYVVVVNGRAACQKHIDQAMKPVGDVASIIREAMSKEAESG